MKSKYTKRLSREYKEQKKVREHYKKMGYRIVYYDYYNLGIWSVDRVSLWEFLNNTGEAL